jgi:hypothetical protein
MDLSQTNTPVFLPRSTRWVLAVDLGQSSDPTALSILQHQVGVIDSNSDYQRHTNTGQIPQTDAKRINVKYLERLKLGTTYPDVIEHIAGLLQQPPLCGDDSNDPATLVVDDSGVGRPVSDLLIDRGLRPIRVTIVPGAGTVCVGTDTWHVSKQILVSTVDAMLHIGTLRFAAELSDAPAMKEELKNFRRKLSEAGRASYAARSGQHDDMVLSVAIGCWWLAHPPPPQPFFGVQSGSVRPEATYGGGYDRRIHDAER